MKCFVTPYEGDQDYLFFSYCHEDAAEVYPIIERLVLEGFRVWFDDGIHPGEDWPEVIATHLSQAKLCVAAITKASAESHNCRNEVSFAISGNLPFLSLILEDFPMPAGIRLQLSSANYLRKFELSEDDFYNKLLSSPVLAGCRDASVHADAEKLHRWREHAAQYHNKNTGAAASGGSALPGFSSWFSSSKERQAKKQAAAKPKAQPEKASPASPKPRPSAPKPEEIKPTTAPAEASDQSVTAAAEPLSEAAAAPASGPKQASRPSESRGGRHLKPETPADDRRPFPEELPRIHREQPEEEPLTISVPEYSDSAASDDDGKTVMLPRSGQSDDDEERTVMGGGMIQAILFRISTGEVFTIRNQITVLGRSDKYSDLVLKGNSAISRKHAEIIFRRGQWCIHDLGASFGTSVNGESLAEGQAISLSECSGLTLADEQFFFICGSAYDQVFDEQKLRLLRSAETGETRLLTGSTIPLDRHHQWKDGVLGDARISRSEHAEIIWKSGKLFLVDKNSRNGTFLNGQRLAPLTPVLLHDRDRIAVVATGFVYYEVALGT